MSEIPFTIKNVALIISILSITNALSSTVYTDGLYLPFVNYEHTIYFDQNVSFSKFQSNKKMMLGFTQTNQLISYYAKSYNPNSNNVLAQISIIQNQTLTDIYCQSGGFSTFSIDQLGNVAYFDVKTNYIYFSFPTNSTGKSRIYSTNETIYVLNYFQSNQTTAILYRYDRQNNFQLLEIVQTNITGIVNMKVCKKYEFFISQTIVLWNSTMFMQAFNCTQNCSQVYQMQNDNNSDLYSASVIFYGCANIIVQYDDIFPIKMYSLKTSETIFTIASDNKIQTIDCFDSYCKNLAVFFANNSIVIHQLWGYTSFQHSYIYQYDNFTEFSKFSLVASQSDKIYIVLQDKIQSYLMLCQQQTYMKISGLCFPCDIKCQICDSNNGTCYLCKNPYRLDLGSCYEPYQNDEIYPDQQFISSIVLKTLDTICIVAQKLLLIMQITPIAWMYLQFINYWNICSLYLLINITIPGYFSECLSKVYDAINTSVLQQFGINFQINLPISQSVNYKNILSYSVTSNFIDSNFQNFITICFVLILLLLVRIFQNSLDKKNWLYKQLKLDNFLIIVGQYIPLMSYIFLPVSLIYENMNCKNALDKLNLILNITFIGLSILLPFILFAYFQMIKSKQLNNKRQRKQKIAKKQKILTFKQYNWFFNSLINISISFLISFQVPKLFLIWNFFIFGFGIYISFKSTNHKVNGIILSSHIFLFHLGFIGMYVFQNNQHFMYHHSSSFGLFFLFSGAVHQIQTVFIESMIQIYKWIKLKITAIQPQIKDQHSHQVKKIRFNMKFKYTESKKAKQFQISVLNSMVQMTQTKQVSNSQKNLQTTKKSPCTLKRLKNLKKTKHDKEQFFIKKQTQLIKRQNFVQNQEIQQIQAIGMIGNGQNDFKMPEIYSTTKKMSTSQNFKINQHQMTYHFS